MSLSHLIHILYNRQVILFTVLSQPVLYSKVYMTYICHFKSNFKFLSGSVWFAQLSFPYSYFWSLVSWDRYSKLGREPQILRMSNNYETGFLRVGKYVKAISLHWVRDTASNHYFWGVNFKFLPKLTFPNIKEVNNDKWNWNILSSWNIYGDNTSHWQD